MSLQTISVGGKPALLYLPSNYNSSKAYPCLVFLPGLGETATSGTSKLLVHGPFLYLTAAADLGLDLIVVAIEPNEQAGTDSAGKEVASYLSSLSSAYNISTADPPNLPPYGTSVKNFSLFASNPIFYYGGCGTEDAMYGMQYPDYQAIIAAGPKIAPAWDAWQGVGHSDPVWSDGYNPAWKSPSMGMSIYAKMASLFPLAGTVQPASATPTTAPAKTITKVTTTVTYSDGSTVSQSIP